MAQNQNCLVFMLEVGGFLKASVELGSLEQAGADSALAALTSTLSLIN